MQRRLLCLLACNAAALTFVVGVHTGSAGAASSITVSPSQNLTAGQTVTVSGSGFAPNGQGAILECNGTPSPPQPTIQVAGNPVPVGCTNPLNNVVMKFDANGNLPPTPFTIKTGTIGPPATGQDSAGKDAATDANDYPCPPTAAQQSQTIPCVIAVGDTAKNQGTQVITFQAVTTTTVPTTTATTVAATTAATNPPVVPQEATATTTPAQLSRTGSSQRLVFLAIGGAIVLDAGYLLFSSTRRPRLLRRRH